MKFLDRKAELGEFKALEKLSKKKLFVIALYGLRRVGKTRLLLEYIKERGIYFFVNKNKTSQDLLAEYTEVLRKHGIITELETLGTWEKFVDVITSRSAPPLVFDEFQNFAAVEPTINGIFQKNIDLKENNPGMLIFSGSLIGLMKKLFMDSKEPLYGRIKKGVKLEPLQLSSCLELEKELKLEREELVKIYCLFGGYPKYYVAIEDFSLQGKTAWDVLGSLMLAKDAPLEDEVNSILSQEFGGRSGTYYSILEAIANGNNTLSTIAACMSAQPTSITRQINELRDYFEIIDFEMPFQGKRGIYRIRHPLINFWFSQIYKNFSDYAARKPEFVESLGKNLNAVYGKAFEAPAREFLANELGLAGAKRQWGKIAGAEKGKNTYEIDLIGKCKQGVFAFEFKWKELECAEAMGCLKELENKLKNVHNMPHDTRLGIVAKKLKEKRKLRALGYFAYDIEDF